MNRWLQAALAGAAAVAVWSALWAQQPQQEPASVEQRLEAAEQRLALLEKARDTSAESAARLPDAALETRLGRLESRVEKIEGQSLRQPVGAPSGSYDRMLESRVRMLEQQVARLRR
jgi:hypothetical protein